MLDQQANIAGFDHPCCVCGSKRAFYGYGVKLLKGQEGKWFCKEHRPNQSSG